ncbi:GNAT family N-acetyltransferase [Patulibacter sp. NPDC049589]|uniref:GNAT family N-acetyltransferase n=1 Tax=Patulibacter sp. NPDC049589 TaxID=3154731 RepID=UPI00343E1C10
MSGRMRRVNIQARHHAEILELNAQDVSVLSPMDEDRLLWIVDRCDAPYVIEDDHGVLGFCLALQSGTDYDGSHYAWFAERYPSFLYLDRIAVAERARRKGIGSRLYAACEERARSYGRMLCEVNVKPSNDGSLAFHASRGYVEVAQVPVDPEGTKVVAMFAKELED